jgi:prepilin-type N-terminal cleavage/methylation domain-containing protein
MPIACPQNKKAKWLVGPCPDSATELRANVGDFCYEPTVNTAERSSLRAANHKPRWRSGMTLLELMLVVAIMVVLAALAVPSIQRTFARQALKKGADRVRVAMGQARVRSIRTGVEHAVFISPGGAFFKVAPFSQMQQVNTSASQRQQISDQRRQNNFEEDLLPQGVEFIGTQVGSDGRSAGVMQASEGGSSSAMRPILFYPDGTSQDATVILRNEKQFTMEVHLRGLTGIARTVRPQAGSQQ